MVNTSGEILAGFFYGNLIFEWTLVSQSIENNSSTISWTYSIERQFDITSTSKKAYSIKIDGVTIASGTTTINGGESVGTYHTIATGTSTLVHKEDGTRPFAVQFSQEIKATIEGEYVGTVTSETDTFYLPKIARPTTPKLTTNGLTMGTDYEITLEGNVSDLAHTLKFTFGEITKTLATNVKKSYVWNPSLSVFAPEIPPNKTYGAGTLICETYLDGELVGTTTAEKTIYLMIPESVIPEILSIDLSDAIEDSFEKFSAFVQNNSMPIIKINASSPYGATIETYKVTFDGQTHNEQTVSCEKISTAGNLPVVATVTDSRGRTATKTIYIEVLPYFPPTVNCLNFYRATGEEPDPEGVNVRIAPIFEICPLNNLNDKSLFVRYRVVGSETWTDDDDLRDYFNGYSSNGDVVVALSAIFDVDNSYEISITAQDFFNSSEKIFSIPTGFTLVDFKATGKGIAFGKVAEFDGVMDVGLQAKFTGGILYDVIDSTDDLNTFMFPNTYAITKDRTYTNSPVDGVEAILTVVGRANEYLSQCFKVLSKGDSRTFERFYDADGWGEWVNTLLYQHPIGSKYESSDPTDPGILFGGTWKQIKDVFILAAGDVYPVGSTGGEAEHVLTVEEMPNHSHTIKMYSGSTSASSQWVTSQESATNWANITGRVQATGGGMAHNNMPPYKVFYMWERIA